MSVPLQRLQTTIPNPYTTPETVPDDTDIDNTGEFTARPGNAHTHTEALWFQPRSESSGPAEDQQDSACFPL